MKTKYRRSSLTNKPKLLTFARKSIMAEIGKDIGLAKSLLEQGELVAVPTETVYGLAGNATDPDSVLKIFTTKERPSFDPLIIHTHSIEQVSEYVVEIPEKARILAERFWPGPLTLLLPKKEIIPDIVTSGLSTVAVRIPNHPLSLELLQTLDFPLAAPSANPFGYISPTTATHVNKQLGDKIKYILDGGECTIGIESTIIGFENNQPIIHRLGGMSVEKLETIVGRISVNDYSSSNPKAPGMLKNHYSPRKKIVLGEIEKLLNKYKNTAVLSFQTDYGIDEQVILSRSGDLDEAAKNLFGSLRKLDDMQCESIIAELAPNHGLGRAINDRLKRAAAEK